MKTAFVQVATRLTSAAALAAALAIPFPGVAQADQASTAAIATGAAAIVGALLIDSNNRPYYVNNHHRYYVSQNEAVLPPSP